MSEVKNKICSQCGTQMLRSPDGYICPKCGIQTSGEMIINPPEVTQEEALKILREDADWDWEKFRREAAKDIFTATYNPLIAPNEQVRNAITCAEELIKQLKDGN